MRYIRLSYLNLSIFPTEKLTVLLGEGELDLPTVLENVDFELGVDVGEVDEGEGVGAGLPEDPVEDAVDDDDDLVPTQRLLELLGLLPVLSQLGAGEPQPEPSRHQRPPPQRHLLSRFSPKASICVILPNQGDI